MMCRQLLGTIQYRYTVIMTARNYMITETICSIIELNSQQCHAHLHCVNYDINELSIRKLSVFIFGDVKTDRSKGL